MMAVIIFTAITRQQKNGKDGPSQGCQVTWVVAPLLSLFAFASEPIPGLQFPQPSGEHSSPTLFPAGTEGETSAW